MAVTYFDVISEDAAGGSYRAGPATAGPWAGDLQHGGPPTALLVHAAERLAWAETGRSDLTASRIAAEFLAAVPIAEVAVTARIVRAARSAVLVASELSVDGRSYLHARIWLLGHRDTARLASAADAPRLADTSARGLGSVPFPYGESLDWRMLSGGLDRPGPGMAWARPRLALLPGRELSGLQRAALIGDSASGISSELDRANWSFVNVDLDVHLARPMHDEWLLMDAATQLGTHGFALARSSLSDLAGPLGSTAQTLVIAPRRG